MLRMTEYLREVLEGKEVRAFGDSVILIWNLTNRCNLYCKLCYSSAKDIRSYSSSSFSSMRGMAFLEYPRSL